MLVVKTKEQSTGNGSLITGLTIGDCIFTISEEEWKSFEDHITEAKAYLYGSDNAVEIDLEELYRTATIIENPDNSVVNFLLGHGCDDALVYLRETINNMKRKSKYAEKIDAIVFFQEQICSKYPEQSLILCEKNGLTDEPRNYQFLFDSCHRGFRFGNREPWNINWNEETKKEFIRNNLYELQFLEDIDEIWCRFIVGPNMFKIKLIEVKEYDGIVSIQLLNSPYSPKLASSRYNGIGGLILARNQNLEEFFRDLRVLYTGETMEKVSLQIKKCLEKEKACFYILENQIQKEDGSFEIIGEDENTFHSICESFKVVFEHEFGAEDPDDLFVFTEWNDLKTLPDPDWGLCVNPEIIPKMLEKKKDMYMILVLMYIKDR